MIKSMTGFGKSAGKVKDRKISVEARSVNSKGLDTNFRLPNLFRDKEIELKNFLSEKLRRGKIDLTVIFDSSLEERHVSLNKTIAKKHFAELKSLCRELKLPDEEMLLALLRMPDIFKPEKEEFTAHDWKVVLSCIGKAVSALDKFRTSEGKSLEKDLRKRIDFVLKYLLQVDALDKGRIEIIKEKLRKNLEELISKDRIDENRFEQELIYHIEKLDITEEKVRLKTHCDYFLQTMNENECGRKLGFISQEIGREINTIGSKASDAGIQKVVVQMKDELEKIKEQLNNVL
ncbi:MAG: YicC family protein [Bacteroidetes bacterium]|nr:YicC family protein [Bacteroidota bacterium]